MNADERAAVASAVLERSRADATQVTVESVRTGLTRFSHETVHQNIDASNASVRVRAIVDGRVGSAATNAFDPAALADVAARAHEIARLAPRETVPPLLAAGPAPPEVEGVYVATTADATADDRARIAAAMFAQVSAGLWSSGFATTSHQGLTIHTSTGARRSFDSTDAAANVKMSGPDSTGFAESYSRDASRISGTDLGREAARLAHASRAPHPVEPGDWTVILAPAAFGEVLRYLILHFSAEAYADGSSFLSGKLDTAVLGANVTIYDDFAHPLHPCMPFDYEGALTERIALIEGGVARNIVTDSAWAQRLGRPNTGHAVAPPSTNGPQSNATVVAPGTASLEALISGTRRGLLVTRLWYVRVVDQRTALLTGMTRDGTFLIEDGEVRGGVRNLRFNTSIVAALNDCEFADTPLRTGGYHYSLVTPAVKFNHFHFASVSPY